MVGERGDRDRETVRWELDETTPPPFSNGGLQMGMQYGGNITTSASNYQNDEIQSSGGGGGGGGAGAQGGVSTGIVVSGATGGGTGKEVRFPNDSPTHSNLMSHIPLQRAHSR